VHALSRLAALLVLAVPLAASAGVRFDFTNEVTGDAYTYRGRIAIEGNRSRLDIVEGSHPLFNPNFSFLTRGDGTEIVVLDHAHKTYFTRKTSNMSGHLATTRGLGKSRAAHATYHRAEDGSRYILGVTYDLSNVVEGERFGGTVTLEATLDVDPILRQKALPWGLLFGIKTGYESIDRALARRLTDRLPRKQVVTVSRRIAGGPEITTTMTTVIENITNSKVDYDELRAPDAYRYQEPSFVFGR
jgi:hypothetical protein